MPLPFQGASLRMPITQGDALGCVLVAPSGRMVHNNCTSYFLQITYYSFHAEVWIGNVSSVRRSNSTLQNFISTFPLKTCRFGFYVVY